MPILLKDVKKALESDFSKVGKDGEGNYKFVPPSIVGRKIRQYPTLKLTKIESVARPGLGVMSYTGLSSSENQAGVRYKVSINFHDMKFKEIESKQFNQESKVRIGGKRVSRFHRPPKARTNPVMMRCQCQDFRHRFEHPLAERTALIGGPRKYTRKTDAWPVGRPSVNSTNKVGICKHISSFLIALKKEGMVKE